MNPIVTSGYYYPNKLVLASFNALVEVMGKNGFNAMLNLAHLGTYIHNFPSDNWEKGFDFSDFSAIQIALEEMYGREGGQLFIKRAGRAAFRQALCQYGALVGVSNPAFRSLPLPGQISLGLQALARVMTQVSDQMTSVEESESELRYVVRRCPHCWGRTQAPQPMCSFGTGLLEEGLSYFSAGLRFGVEETRCIGAGETACVYTIGKKPLNHDHQEMNTSDPVRG